MLLTDHGNERILGRTRLSAKDVLSIIEHGACVSLGSLNGQEYLLFYSPFDSVSKIAVTSGGRTILVSVWERHFILPHGLKKVTSARMGEARRFYKNFVFARIKKNNPPPTADPSSFRVSIEVLDEGVVAFTHEGGTLTEYEGQQPLVFRLMEPQLELLAKSAEHKKNGQTGKIKYRICLYKQDPVKPAKVHEITHNAFRRRSWAAA